MKMLNLILELKTLQDPSDLHIANVKDHIGKCISNKFHCISLIDSKSQTENRVISPQKTCNVHLLAKAKLIMKSLSPLYLSVMQNETSIIKKVVVAVQSQPLKLKDRLERKDI